MAPAHRHFPDNHLYFLHAYLSQIVPETQKMKVLIPKTNAVGRAAPCLGFIEINKCVNKDIYITGFLGGKDQTKNTCKGKHGKITQEYKYIVAEV